ncbi:hypothetical protein JCM8097_005592 [Rhodosporidiobolus ruineniae]
MSPHVFFAASCPSPFDGLPDEVVSLIFDLLFDRHDPAPPDLTDVLLNKRLYALAKPVYFSAWVMDHEELPLVFFKDDARCLIRELHYTPSGRGLTSFTFETLSLSAFTNLTALHSGGLIRERDVAVTLPESFSQALSTFAHLTTLALDFENPFDFADSEFSIGGSLPRLHDLTAGEYSRATRQLLAEPTSSLRRLTMDSSRELDARSVYDAVLWSSLTTFSATASKIPVPLPLREFQLLDDLFLPPASDSASDSLRREVEDEVRTLFELLNLTAVEKLSISPGTASSVPSDLSSIASVRKLTLGCDDVILSDSIQLYGLYRLLGSFPSLVELRLEGAEFNSVLQAEERIALSPTSPGFLLHHAPLGSLVLALLETPILRLVWFAEPETYRWTRSSREENFVAERYK